VWQDKRAMHLRENVVYCTQTHLFGRKCTWFILFCWSVSPTWRDGA